MIPTLTQSSGWVDAKRGIMIAKVDTGKCTGCGACVDICPVDAIKIEDNKAVSSEECIGCRACETQCPTGAIKVS
ncbi:MAG: 4Fe-4S binding protein [Candidatus Omnitrophota bacterium]|nr:4Fe-4S binding protein [Candidatus Omnitrophota bacterium]